MCQINRFLKGLIKSVVLYYKLSNDVMFKYANEALPN